MDLSEEDISIQLCFKVDYWPRQKARSSSAIWPSSSGASLDCRDCRVAEGGPVGGYGSIWIQFIQQPSKKIHKKIQNAVSQGFCLDSSHWKYISRFWLDSSHCLDIIKYLQGNPVFYLLGIRFVLSKSVHKKWGLSSSMNWESRT
jgi:hypothetical protein